jgi:hypothetical protein
MVSLCTPAVSRAQPSGGPYGPLAQVYDVPAGAAHVLYVAPDGRADAPGATPDRPTTLEAAIPRVVTGDAIILRGGTYRTGGLVLNQGITLQPYRDEQPVLKGTAIATNWEPLRDGIWRTKWATLFPCQPRDWWQRNREGMRTPLHRFNNDMVFLDGRALQSAGWEGELTADTYYIDYDTGYVYLKNDPAGRLIEITARDSALVVTGKRANDKDADHRGPAIRGITFTQYAYRALEVEGRRGSVPPSEEPTDDPIGLADPATIGKEVVGTLLENCALTHCSRVAGYFRGDRLVIRHCLVSDTSTEGLYVIGSSDCVLEKNLIARNNVEQLTGYYPAAVKIFNQTHRVVFRDNLVTDNPNSNGVWYDVGNVDGVFVNNWIEDCQDGLFFEISHGIICAGNVFVRCNKGVRILNSRDARIYHNTFVNAPASFERNERSNAGDHFGWHITTGPAVAQRAGHRFVGNLLVADATFTRPLLAFEQSPALRGRLTESQAVELDYNGYVRPAAGLDRPLIAWAPASAESASISVKTPAELHEFRPAFEAHSQLRTADPGTVLRSPELKRYDAVARLGSDSPLPADIAPLLGWAAADAYAPGAYPARR